MASASDNRPIDRGQQGVLARRQRLFDQRHAGIGGDAQMVLQRVFGPAFVGVEDD
jgi:hypothetical protein